MLMLTKLRGCLHHGAMVVRTAAQHAHRTPRGPAVVTMSRRAVTEANFRPTSSSIPGRTCIRDKRLNILRTGRPHLRSTSYMKSKDELQEEIELHKVTKFCKSCTLSLKLISVTSTITKICAVLI